MTNRLYADLHSAWKGAVGGGGASVVAVVALAVGIGASVTAASVAYAGLLRPLPFPDSDRLVTVQKVFKDTGSGSGVALAEFDEWRPRVAGVLDLAAIATERVTLQSDGEPREVLAAYVSGNWFAMLGGPGSLGRLLDERSSLDDAVVSRVFADREGRGDAAAMIGRTFTIGSRPLRIVGVLLATHGVIDDADVWILARGVPALNIVGGRDARTYRLIGRLGRVRSLEAAREDAVRVLSTLLPEKQPWHFEMTSLRAALVGDSRPVLILFLAASMLVLLVACANVAMLMVNRAVARTREFAVRMALGASRARLILVSIGEAGILTAAGAVGGWWIARLGSAFIRQQTGLNLPAIATVTAGHAIGAGTAIAAVCVAVLCGLAPLPVLRRRAMMTALRTATLTGSRTGRRVRTGLVIAELAMTMVLLTGAGLLGRTLLAVSRADIGLDAPALVMTIAVPVGQSTGDAASRLQTVQRIVEEVRRLPGVTAAGAGAALPPNTAGLAFSIRVTTTDRSVDAMKTFDLVPVTDGYLESLGARLVEGRLFEPADALASEPTVVLSESAATHLSLIRRMVVGQPLNLALPTANGPRVKPRVIGVIKDIRYSGLDARAHGGIYLRWSQLPLGTAFVVARTRREPASIGAAMTRVVRTIDPSIPVNVPASFDTVVDRALAPRAARFSLVGIFAVGAALLGAIGLSGALARSVVERQRELAIRAAIGAAPRRLLQDVLRHGLLHAAAGIAIGLGLSALVARTASAMIFGVTPHDPLTYAATTAGLLAVTLCACYVPARRAAAADPVTLLRSE